MTVPNRLDGLATSASGRGTMDARTRDRLPLTNGGGGIANAKLFRTDLQKSTGILECRHVDWETPSLRSRTPSG